MHVKPMVWILSVLFFWMAGPAGAPVAWANGPAGGTSGCVDDTWAATNQVGAPSARFEHTAVWTGTEMLVWGGIPATNTGGRYDPTTDTWAAISTEGAPSARGYHTAVWTGTEMIVWGGSSSSPPYVTNTGGRYDPATDTWRAISTDGAPSGRVRHTAIWTGTEMIVWGSTSDSTGGRYDPATDTWAATSTVGAPSARYYHTAVWTGSEMLVWGGEGGGSLDSQYNTGGRYDPASDTWTATTTVRAPIARSLHTAVWTGAEMIVWGGWYWYYDPSDDIYRPIVLNTGGRYCASASKEDQ